MSLWMPPRVQRELAQERSEYEALIAILTECDDVPDLLNRRVSEIDPNLAVVKAKPTVPWGVPLKPGYFHLVRRNETAPVSVTVIEGPDGEYIEPGSKMLDLIRSRDLWNPQVRADLAAAEEERKRAAQRELERDREEINEEVLERFKAGTQASVSMNQDTPWSQNASGRRGAKAD